MVNRDERADFERFPTLCMPITSSILWAAAFPPVRKQLWIQGLPTVCHRSGLCQGQAMCSLMTVNPPKSRCNSYGSFWCVTLFIVWLHIAARYFLFSFPSEQNNFACHFKCSKMFSQTYKAATICQKLLNIPANHHWKAPASRVKCTCCLHQACTYSIKYLEQKVKRVNWNDKKNTAAGL